MFEVLSCLGDEKKLEECSAMYEDLDEESTKAILGMAGVETKLKKLFVRKAEGGKKMYQLCKAFADHMETGRKQGIEQGIEQSLQNLMKNKKISLKEAMEWLGISPECEEQYKSLV